MKLSLVSMSYLLFFNFFPNSNLRAETLSSGVGIIGDNLALGAASHPAFSLDLHQISKVMTGESSVKATEDQRLYPFGIKKDLDAPRILAPGIRDYYGSTDWVYSHLMDSFSESFFMTPQYSWSYMLARKLKVEAQHILLAAELGAKVDKIPRQIDRLLDVNGGNLPSKIFIFFSGNDLCASTMNGITSAEEFGASLLQGLKYIVRNGTPHPEGTRIYIPHYLPLSQLINKESILSYPMNAFGEKNTCKDLRKNGFQARKFENFQDLPAEAHYITAFMPPNFASKCPTLFNHEALALNELGFLSHFNDQKKQKELKRITSDYLSLIATRIRNYRIQSDLAVQKINEWMAKTKSPKKFYFSSLKHTGDISIEGEDLAQDCFHLNMNGQVKIAEALLSEL